jgi:hypothetical protein
MPAASPDLEKLLEQARQENELVCDTYKCALFATGFNEESKEFACSTHLSSSAVVRW